MQTMLARRTELLRAALAKLPYDLRLLLLLIAIMACFPVVFHTRAYIMHILIMSLIWSGVCMGWDLIMGYAGIFTFGQVALFVVGAYATGILSKLPLISPWLGVFLGGSVAAAAGILIGLPCLRLKGVYIALVTFAFHLVLGPLIRVGGPIGTGGAMNLRGMPPLTLWGAPIGTEDKVTWFYLLLGVMSGLYFLNWRIIHSKFGVAFTALRDHELLARTAGVDAYRINLMMFALSAFFTGLLGGFYVEYVGIISTKILGLDIFLFLMVILIVGGLGRFPGVIMGSVAVTFMNYYLRPLEHFRLVLFGAIVLLLVIVMPGGIMEVIDKVSHKVTRRFRKTRNRA